MLVRRQRRRAHEHLVAAGHGTDDDAASGLDHRRPGVGADDPAPDDGAYDHDQPHDDQPGHHDHDHDGPPCHQLRA